MQYNSNTIEIVEAEIVETEQSSNNTTNRKSLAEYLLSKRALDLMMSSGGGLLVTGFAVWLWSIGIFENALILACSVGVANLALLGVGMWMFLASSYKVTGRGILLLASMVLPLNLWLYHSQGLISISDGGNLWIPALFISVIYAAVTRLTRDSLFVYTFVGGISLTGTLFIASATGLGMASILPVATLFVVIGAVCIHADGWFFDNTGDFSRDKFGVAFFRSGLSMVIAGLGVLFTGRFATAIAALTQNLANHFQTPEFLTQTSGEFWTLGILLTAIYSCSFISFTRRRHSSISTLGVLTSLWATATIVGLFNIELTFHVALLLIALLLIAGNVVRGAIGYKENELSHFFWSAMLGSALMLFIATDYLLTDLLIGRTLFVDWISPALIFASAISLLTLPGLWNAKRNTDYVLISIGSAGFSLAVIVALFGLSSITPSVVLVVATAIPALLAVICLMLNGRQVSHAIGTVVLGAALAVMVSWLILLTFSSTVIFASVTSLAMIVILAASCGVVNFATGNRSTFAASLTLVNVAVFQWLVHFNLLNAYAITTAISLAGLTLIVTRFAAGKWKSIDYILLQRTQQLGNVLVQLGATGAILFTTFSLIGQTAELQQVGLLAIQLVGLGIAFAFTKDIAWRRTFQVTAGVAIVSGIIIVGSLSTLTLVQKFELGSLVLGALLTIAGYVGWSKEGSIRSDGVSFSLLVGSILLAAPMVVGLISDRIYVDATITAWRYLHEIGGLVVALLLLGSGIVSQTRSTTLSGMALLMVIVISNILLIEFPDQLQQTSVLMMIGGGTFFGTALLLSVYRERLMTLPEKIKEGKGIFKVLRWR